MTIKEFIFLKMIWDLLDEMYYVLSEGLYARMLDYDSLKDFPIERPFDKKLDFPIDRREKVLDRIDEIFPNEVSLIDIQSKIRISIDNYLELPNIYKYSEYLSQKLQLDEDLVYERLEELYSRLTEEDILTEAGFELEEITSSWNLEEDIEIEIRPKNFTDEHIEEFMFKNLYFCLKIISSFNSQNEYNNFTFYLEDKIENILDNVSLKNLNVLNHLELTGECKKLVDRFVTIYKNGENYHKNFDNFQWIEDIVGELK